MTPMFGATDRPRIFGLPPGADFPRALVDGLLARLDDRPPEALAQVTLYVNTARMQRRIRDIFDSGPARLLPRIRLVTDLGREATPPLPPQHSNLRRQLELSQLTSALITAEPGLAPVTSAFQLATTLAALFDELQGEGVPLSALHSIDTGDLAAHWQKSLSFLQLIGECLPPDPAAPRDAEGRRRLLAEALTRQWQRDPPDDPVLVAGSTGSRGTTRMLMEAVARLPQGAVILPGVDFDLPADIWSGLSDPAPQEDHPQFRAAALASALNLHASDIQPWREGTAPDPGRNRLISLALHPAPVTDGWLSGGPKLGELPELTGNLALIEASDLRSEAGAIALILREAAEDARRAALITPDRMLTRRVAAALDRWGIIPDDSGGEPLGQTPSGRLLRHVAQLFGRPGTSEALIELLKHPLTRLGAPRGTHLIWTRELEMWLRRDGPLFLTEASLDAWSETEHEGSEEIRPWIASLGRLLALVDTGSQASLALFAARLRDAAGILMASGPEDTQPIWPGEDGMAAERALIALEAEAPFGGEVAPAEFQLLLAGLLTEEIRDPVATHPHVMIWGTLEARVMGADLVILGGLNDGIWPKWPDPDPWLNRHMRKSVGLLSPERQIGLSAHDFQQAAGAGHVILSRSTRDEGAATIPSRWLNRLTNLMAGLPDQRGPEALAAMRARGAVWLDRQAALDRPPASVPPEPRPAPCPPVAHRPNRLSVTEIETLIRDPYAIYARNILRLKPLDPLHRGPDARDRGTVLHTALEQFVRDFPDCPPEKRRARLLDIASDVLEQAIPWPTAKRLWHARLDRVADHFLAEEAQRQARADPISVECRGALTLTDPAFTLTAKADRIDRAPDGAIWIYDYKTGTPPPARQQMQFSKQLLLEAVIAEGGGFDVVGPARVAGAEYIGLGARPKTVPAPLEDVSVPQLLEGFIRLITTLGEPDTGYPAQAARFRASEPGDYDQLSRFGEWDLSQSARLLRVGS